MAKPKFPQQLPKRLGCGGKARRPRRRDEELYLKVQKRTPQLIIKMRLFAASATARPKKAAEIATTAASGPRRCHRRKRKLYTFDLKSDQYIIRCPLIYDQSRPNPFWPDTSSNDKPRAASKQLHKPGRNPHDGFHLYNHVCLNRKNFPEKMPLSLGLS